jgi:hypothetical protein
VSTVSSFIYSFVPPYLQVLITAPNFGVGRRDSQVIEVDKAMSAVLDKLGTHTHRTTIMFEVGSSLRRQGSNTRMNANALRIKKGEKQTALH